ncbi:5225_t:CDS:2 [Paraglomus occultum]|uniref:5225_t:CDS:1 n=1 Tax=Paraglomus occultum TaxID=144539 RepID=A0A9N8WQB8_9GLOM|nr:5225_t:CDS:2 [Paraglomus occultum]
MTSLLNANNASMRTYSSSSPTPPLADSAAGTLKRWSWLWWKEWTIIFAVFAVTGSTTVRVVRPIVTNVFGIEGSFTDGPWSYRLTYLAITLPLYSVILFGLGTLVGRRAYFGKIVTRMWGRFIPKRLLKRPQSIRDQSNGNNQV